MSYAQDVLAKLKEKNASEPEFIQAATEVLTSLEPVFEKHPEFEKASLLERIVELRDRLCSVFLGLTTTVRYR